jgi:hypothetical protein
MGPLVITAKKDDLTPKEQAYHSFALARSVEEMLNAPDSIKIKDTFANCFGFKCLEIDMLKCLVS